MTTSALTIICNWNWVFWRLQVGIYWTEPWCNGARNWKWNLKFAFWKWAVSVTPLSADINLVSSSWELQAETKTCMTSSFPSPALRQDTLDLTPLTAFFCRSKDGETSHSPKGRGFRLFQSGGGNVGAGGSTAEAGTGTLTKDAIMSRVGQRWDCCYDYCCFQSVCLSDFNIPSQFHVLISYQSKLGQD